MSPDPPLPPASDKGPSKLNPTEEFGVELEWPSNGLSGSSRAEAPPVVEPVVPEPDEGSSASSTDAPEVESTPDPSASPYDKPSPEMPGETELEGAAAVTEEPRPASVGATGELDGDSLHDQLSDASVVRTRSTAWSPALLPPTAAPPPAVRSDALQGALTALAMRIDSLVGATSTNRSSITERLNDHIDAVGHLARAQIADLAEFQRVNERTLGDVRHSVQATTDLVRRLAEGVDRLQGDLGGLHGDLGGVREAQHRLPEVADAIVRVQSSIDQLRVAEPEADASANRFEVLRSELLAASSDRSGVEEELARQVEGLRVALEALREEPVAEGPSEVELGLRRVEERLEELAGSRVDPAVMQGLGRVEARLGVQGGRQEELARQFEALREALEAARKAPDEPAVVEGPSELELGLRRVEERLADLGSSPRDTELIGSMRRLEEWMVDLGAHTGTQDELSRQVGALTAAIETLRELPDEPEVEGPSEVELGLRRVEQQLAALGTSHDDEVTEGLRRLEEKVTRQGAPRVDGELHEAVRRLEARLEDLVEAGSSTERSDEWPVEADLGARIDGLHEQLSELAERVSPKRVVDRLDRLESLLMEERGDPVGAAASPDQAPLADELHDVRTRIDTLHSEVGSLVAQDVVGAIAGLRKDLNEFTGSVASAAEHAAHTAPSPAGTEVGTDVEELVAGVQKELATLRRRISVRAKPVDVVLDDEQSAALADAVVARLRQLLEVVPNGEERE